MVGYSMEKSPLKIVYYLSIKNSFALIFPIVFILILSSCAFVEKYRLEKATEKNTIEAIDDFERRYPDSPYLEEARWHKANLKNEVLFYKNFLFQYPNSVHMEEAKNRIDDLYYDQKRELGTISAFYEYLDKYPTGRHAEDARWYIAEETDNINLYEKFIVDFPDSYRIKKAEGRVYYLTSFLSTNEATALKALLFYNERHLHLSVDEYKRLLERIKSIAKEKSSGPCYLALYSETGDEKYLQEARVYRSTINNSSGEKVMAENFPTDYFSVESCLIERDVAAMREGENGSPNMEYTCTVKSSAKFHKYRVKVAYTLPIKKIYQRVLGGVTISRKEENKLIEIIESSIIEPGDSIKKSVIFPKLMNRKSGTIIKEREWENVSGPVTGDVSDATLIEGYYHNTSID
jgi:outer membrane protein assembly factor BamD (BamD/ComL family)